MHVRVGLSRGPRLSSVWGTTSSFGTLRRLDPRHEESMFRPLGMSDVPMICFRLSSAFGTGMFIEGHAKVY